MTTSHAFAQFLKLGTRRRLKSFRDPESWFVGFRRFTSPFHGLSIPHSGTHQKFPIEFVDKSIHIHIMGIIGQGLELRVLSCKYAGERVAEGDES